MLRFLRKISVKHRIIGGFLVLVCLMAGTLPLVIKNHNHFQAQLHQFYEVETRADRLLLQASNHIMSSRVNFLRYYHDYLPSTLQAVADIDCAKMLLVQAGQIISLPKQKTVVAGVLEKVAHYKDLVKGFQGAGLHSARKDYPRLVYQVLHTGNEISIHIGAIVKESDAHVSLTIHTLQKEIKSHAKILAMVFSAIVLLGLVISILMARSITRPLSELGKGIEGLRRGIHASDIPVEGEDEFSLLARTLNQLTADLEKTTTSIDMLHAEMTLREVAEGKLKKSHQELKETQNQLIQSGKLASIGELAAGVAHELNQPLMVVRANAQLLTRQLQREALDVESLKEGFASVERNTKRMMNIINHLRIFSRQSGAEHESIDINKIINDSFLMMGEQLRLRNIECKKELAAALPRCHGNASQLEQVILNLLANARDALSLKIEKTKRAEDRQSQIVIHTSLSDGDGEIEILIKDNGDGISPDHLNHIFNPFYTTKDVGQGTGLGLSISYGIIQDHQGRIDVAETGPAGTTFQIRLPLQDGSGR